MNEFKSAWNAMNGEQKMEALEWVLNETRNPFLTTSIVVKDGMVLGAVGECTECSYLTFMGLRRKGGDE